MDYQQMSLFSEPAFTQENLRSFQGVFRASHFPWPESRPEKKMNVIYGPKCLGLSPSYIRLISSVRTYLESSKLPLTTFVRTWSVRATKSEFLIMKLRLSERRTEGNGSFLWATPNAADCHGSHGGRAGEEPEDGHIKLEKEPMENTSRIRCGEPGVLCEQPRGAESLSTSQIVADTPGAGIQRFASISASVPNKGSRQGQPDTTYGAVDASNAGKWRLPQSEQKSGSAGKIGHIATKRTQLAYNDWWSIEPDVGRVAYGISSRVDRLKCLGNAVVPYQAYPIFKAIAEIELMTANRS